MPLNVLLVEDDDSDMMLTEMALEASNIYYSLRRLDDGTQVLPYLHHEPEYANRARPDVIFLDLTLPGKDGAQILSELKAEADLYGKMPIVILTGDRNCAFLAESDELSIPAYITKPCSTEKILNVLLAIRQAKRGI